MAFKKILVPIDASEMAEKCLDKSLALAGAFDSQVIVLSVRPEPASLIQTEAKESLDSFEDEAARVLAMAYKRLEGTGCRQDQVKSEVRAGGPEHAILEAAEDHMVDLIVMGTHGRTGLIEKMAGSTTERVLARSSASVLALKAAGFPYLRE